MIVYANGEIPLSALSPVPGFAGAYLTREAANSFGRVANEVHQRYGWRPTLTSAGDAYRSYARQEAVFRERYVPRFATYGLGGIDRRGPWRGLYWWRYRGAAAAVPGTSNHGRGVAVDIKDMGPFSGSRFRQFAAVSVKHGWSNAEGARVSEPWHWVYSSSGDTVLISNPGVGWGEVDIDTPDVQPIEPINPIDPEEDDEMKPHLMYHPDGTVAVLRPTLGEMQILRTADEPAGLIAAKMVDPEMTVDPRDKDKDGNGINGTGSGLVWNLVEGAAKRAGKFIP